MKTNRPPPAGDAARLKALCTALIAGEQSGSPTEFDFDAFIARKRAQHISPPDDEPAK